VQLAALQYARTTGKIGRCKARGEKRCLMKFHCGLTRRRRPISSPSTAKSDPGINSRCRVCPIDCSKRFVIGRKGCCGGRISYCSCRIICTRCFPFRQPESRYKRSSASGKNGLPKTLESPGSGIFSSIGCAARKAAERRRITFCRIRSAGNWSHAPKNGLLFILAMAIDTSLRGRDIALRCPRPRSSGRNESPNVTALNIRFRRLTLCSATGTA